MCKCNLCPNSCNVERNITTGFCGVSNKIKIAKYSLLQLEEPPISGKLGSGAIFFSGCSLKCVFCQNYSLSRNQTGKDISIKELSEIFYSLEKSGATNINLVNPTHYSYQIVEALKLYHPNIPIVWNTHGYETLDTLKFVNDFVDIYLTDFKYLSSDVSFRYSGKKNYFDYAIKALPFMLNKTTVLENGLMKKGVIVRHLILPQNAFDSREIVTVLRPYFTNDNNAYLSLMAQYTPYGDIDKYPELKRRITTREYNSVLKTVIDLNYKNVFTQSPTAASESFIPIWDF